MNGAIETDLDATDLFCGAGGSSWGAEQAGVRLRMAANHWPKAIEVHQANFPDAGHDCADVSQADPRRYPRTDLLIASPECTNHSSSKGVSRKLQAADLFSGPDAVADRSRATMWCPVRFAEHHRYDAIIIENVVDAASWILFRSWLAAWDDLGYTAQIVMANSAHIGDPVDRAPQWRDRMYVVLTRKGLPLPDVAPRPPAWCDSCETAVNGLQSFKRADRAPWGRYRSQYLYRCPTCLNTVEPFVAPAAKAIDWALPAQRIGDRAKPLAANTLKRIRIGLERYAMPFVAQAAGHTFEREGYIRAWQVDEPLRTQAATIQHALVGSGEFLVQPHHSGGDGARVRSVDEPLWTATASRDMPAVVVPLRRNGRVRPVDEPVPTVAANGFHHGLLMAPQSGGEARPTSEPMGALTAKVPPLLVPYYGTSKPHPVDRPMGAVTTRDRNALVDVAEMVDDCTFRMLEPHEVGAAMAFPATYKVEGTKTERVKLYGNAVTPPVMQWLVGQVKAALAAA